MESRRVQWPKLDMRPLAFSLFLTFSFSTFIFPSPIQAALGDLDPSFGAGDADNDFALARHLGDSGIQAVTIDVDMGNNDAPCGSFDASDIGFVDCTSSTGGILVTAMTTIAAGDTVRWTMRSVPHTVTTEAGLTGGPAAACGTGDNFDSGTANAFTPGFVYTHQFNTPGTCTYFCIIHPTTMQGQVVVLEPGQTTSTTTPTTTTTTTTIPGTGVTFNVDMGDMAAPCGGASSSDIGFVDCTSSTGGILVTAMTTIAVGDTVQWTMRSTPHTATSGIQPTAGVCATGDNFDSGTANAFTPGLVFTHQFNTPGTCAYFCIIHPSTMTGQVNVLGPGQTTSTTTSTTSTTTTTIFGQTTTTTTIPTTTTTTTLPNQGGIFNVDMGDMAAPCGGAGPSDIGFVDCTSSTGGILVNAVSTISAGDTVRWTMRSTPHTATSGNQPTVGACATGDNFDSGTANAFTPGFVFTHQFNTPGTCAYFCIIHPSTMMGQVNVLGPGQTTSTTTSTTSTTTTTIFGQTTTTTTIPTTTTTTTLPNQGGIFNVDMGDMAAPCGGAGPSDIGFVDCTSSTGGILVNAVSTISAGDTVRWTMRSTPHTATSGNQPTVGACATGDNFDSGTANAFTPGLVFTHQFNTPGTCAYFCIIHPSTMMGQVNVLGPGQTTSTTTSTTSTTTTTIFGQTTTTSTTTTTTTLPNQGGIFNVDMGDMAPPSGGAGPSDIGFVDSTSSTGGILETAMTTINVGETVRWTMTSTPHTTTSEAGLTGGPAAPCGTGDSWDSGVANAFTPGFVFTHQFNTPGTCTYFCIIHPTTMQGQVNVGAAGGTTTTTTTIRPTTTTTRPTTTTSTTLPGHTVEARVDSFAPADITINPGDTVTWVTQSVSAGVHTVTGDPSAPNGPDSLCQEALEPTAQFLDTVGETYAHTFNTPGLCHYVCLIHQVSTGMIGTVQVNAAGGTTTTSTTVRSTTTTSATLPGQTTTTRTVTTTSVTSTTLGGPTTTTSTTLPGQTTTTRTVTTTSVTSTTLVGPTTTTSTTLPGQTTTTRTVTTTSVTSTTLVGQTTTTSTTLPGQPTTTSTTTTFTTTTTVRATTTITVPTTTVATTTTTVATTTTTSTTTTLQTTTTTTTSTTTTTVISTLEDVGVLKIIVPNNVSAGDRKVEVRVKNYGRSAQIRSLSLTLNGVPVSGSPVSITMKGDHQDKVEFDVFFETKGTATLQTSLSPVDANPANDMNSLTVEVKK